MRIYKEHLELHIRPCGEDSLVIVGKKRDVYDKARQLLEKDLVEFAKNKWNDIPENVRSEKDLREYLGPDDQNDYMTWEFRVIKTRII